MLLNAASQINVGQALLGSSNILSEYEHAYTSYVIATPTLVLTQIIVCFLANQVDINAEN